MKTLLFINGCVRGEHSRTLKIAKAYLETLQSQEDFNLIERDLSDEEIGFLTEKSFDTKTGNITGGNGDLALEFAAADEIVLAAPFWEFLFPAVVSCYFEMVSIPGITFQYTDRGSEGLCKAASLTYIYTSGNLLEEEDKISEKFLQKLKNLYGIPAFKAILGEGLDIDPSKAPSIVEEVCQKIRDKQA